MIRAEIRSTSISLEELRLDTACEGAGALDLFTGIARHSSPGRPGVPVVRLEYEGYEPMAERELASIARECVDRFEALNVIVIHRVGLLEIGDVAVAIAVWAGHRANAFNGCRYIIEEIKKRVPIWKKEVFNDGSAWVHARP